MPCLCCADGCDNSRENYPKKQFNCIPKDLDRRNKWLAANKTTGSQHLISDCAVNTLYLPAPLSMDMLILCSEPGNDYVVLMDATIVAKITQRNNLIVYQKI